MGVVHPPYPTRPTHTTNINTHPPPLTPLNRPRLAAGPDGVVLLSKSPLSRLALTP
jgi:hypothetical protein